MRIGIDLDLCQGHGMCEMEAPEVFRADIDHAEILDSEPDEGLRGEVEAAVQYCPTQALRLIDD